MLIVINKIKVHYKRNYFYSTSSEVKKNGGWFRIWWTFVKEKVSPPDPFAKKEESKIIYLGPSVSKDVTQNATTKSVEKVKLKN